MESKNKLKIVLDNLREELGLVRLAELWQLARVDPQYWNKLISSDEPVTRKDVDELISGLGEKLFTAQKQSLYQAFEPEVPLGKDVQINADKGGIAANHIGVVYQYNNYAPTAPAEPAQKYTDQSKQNSTDATSTRQGQNNPLTDLRQKLIDRYSLEDLRTLCFDLGVDYENLPGEGKSAKARELVTHLQRKGRISELERLLN